MQKGDKGVWSVTVDPPKPEIHYYSFIVDGLQIIDPANPNLARQHPADYVKGLEESVAQRR